MGIDEAIALVARLTYKPGWRLRAYPEPHTGGLILLTGLDEPDSEKPGAVRPLDYTAPLKADELRGLDEKHFLQFVFDTIAKRELHEVEEWLRLDGRPLYEPHPVVLGHRGVLGDGTSIQPPTLR